MMADPSPVLLGNSAAQFNGRIRDTLPAVENVRLQNRTGRACFDTAGTRSAASRNSVVISQFQIGDNTTKKQPGPDLLIDDARVLSEPTNPRILRVCAFQQRPR